MFAILASFNLFLALAILASLNLFLTVSSISIASTANLTSLGVLIPLDSLSNVSAQGSVCPIFAQNSSIFDLPSAFVNMSAVFKSDTTFTTRVLLLHVLAAIASLSECDECSCQFLFAKQLLSHSKNLYAMRVVVSDSIPSFANPILNILPS